MTEKLASILKDKIHGSSLSWKGLVGGLAFPIEKTNQGKDRFTASVFPAGTEVLGGEAKSSWEHHPLTPNSKYKSVIFFEENGTDINENNGFNHESTLRLVCWLNLKLIGESDNSNMKTDDYAIGLMNLLGGNQGNSGSLRGLHVNFNAIPKRDKSIFDNYTFDLADSKYLVFPYSYFALDFTVTYYYNHAC